MTQADEIRRLLAIVRKAGQRRMIATGLRWFFNIVPVGWALGCAVLLLARWFVIVDYRALALVAVAVALVLALISFWFVRPSIRQSASLLDRHLEDRIHTALDHAQEDSAIARLQRNDALLHAERVVDRLPELIQLPRLHFRLPLFIVGALLFIALWLWPNPLDEQIRLLQAEAKWVQEQAGEVGQLVEEAQAEQGADLTDMIGELKQLQMQLETSADLEEAVVHMEERVQRLQHLAEATAAEKMWRETDGARTVSGEDHTKKSGQGADAHDAGDAHVAAGSGEGVQTEDANQHGAATEAAASAGAEEAGTSELEQRERRIRETAQTIASALPSSSPLASSAMAHRADDGTGQAAGAAESGGAAAHAGEAGEQGDAADGAQVPGGAGDGTGAGTDATDARQTAAGSANVGENTDGGAEASMADGSGGRTESGAASDRAGATSAPAGGLAGGEGRGSRHHVTTPRLAGSAGEVEVDSGPLRAEGGQRIDGGQRSADVGEVRSYEQVYGMYADEAQTFTNSGSSLPESVKHRVRNYFLGIQP